MRVRVWGCRGSIASPGPDTIRHGGNTSCVEVRLDDGQLLILDAGTGLRPLGLRLMQERPARIDLLLTHLHVDHLEGLGAFAPIWSADTELHIWGPSSPVASLESRIATYFSPPLFPVHLARVPAGVVFHDAPREAWTIGSAHVRSSPILHPGPTVGYRIEADGRSLAYVTDHEPALGMDLEAVSKEWISGHALAAGADLLIHDCQYDETEYGDRVGWGHSSTAQMATFARKAAVERLLLFHHDPIARRRRPRRDGRHRPRALGRERRAVRRRRGGHGPRGVRPMEPTVPPRARPRRRRRVPPYGSHPGWPVSRDAGDGGLGAAQPVPQEARVARHLDAADAHRGDAVGGGHAARVLLRRDVPRDEERQPRRSGRLLDAGTPPAHLGAIRPRPRARLHGESEPRRGGVDRRVGQAHREPSVAAVLREVEEGTAQRRSRPDLGITTQRSSTQSSPSGTMRFAVPQPGCRPPATASSPVEARSRSAASSRSRTASTT